MHTSPQAEQSFHEHFTDHGGVSVSQNGLHSGSAPHSEQPLQPCQVHLSPQACVLCSQCALHTGAGEGDGGGSPVSDGGSSEHSEQAPQPPQEHSSVQGCVFLSQCALHWAGDEGDVEGGGGVGGGGAGGGGGVALAGGNGQSVTVIGIT